MALGGRLKGLFGGSAGQQTGPLGLRLGAAIELDTSTVAPSADDLWFTLPEGPLPLIAEGLIDFGDGTAAFRYYTEEHELLQIICGADGSDSSIQEVKFFVPLGSIYPEDDEWSVWEGEDSPVGQPTYTLTDGPEYAREWFKDDTGWISPVTFDEQVVDIEGERNHIQQHVMLFARALPPVEGLADRREFLLISLEEHPDGRSVEAMVGIDLEPAMFRII
jgi:hypothetical protein